MTTPREAALDDLRQSIDMLPERTRRAMLSGLGSNTVITGAFTDGSGVCPMLAAHRAGDRTRCMGFPEAWDRFTGVHGRGICRPATQYEVLQLRMQVEASINDPQDSNGFAEAIAEHQASVEARREHSRRQSGGFVADLTGAIEEHRSAARERRSREATDVGLDWLFEETLVLPEDFGATPATEPEQVEDFDFSRSL
ncbi:MAG: hypothetical protein QOE31_1137 [Solirubrobacteraceae bacterium]|jgi:hypothetical protein|nr:hypothetical protein [Solirubrobacteraceae bacterium]